MSQVAAKKRLTLKDERVKVIAHFREEGAVLAGTQRGFCEDFDIELSLNGDIPVEEIQKLIRLAHQMCFTESALTGTPKITSRHVYNGRGLDAF
ncbi:MAG: hypothetical protein AB1607_17570 [Chloroflexota bacterium]